MKCRPSQFVAIVILLFAVFLMHATPVSAETALEKTAVRGVYWPWERTKLNADAAGREFWVFVDEMMARLKTEYHCNLIWFVNGPDDPGRVCDLAAKHGLLVLPGTPLAHYFVYGMPKEDDIHKTVQKTVDLFKNKPACAGYVLKDEPRRNEALQLEHYRRELFRADPTRPAIVVSMTHDTEAYVLETSFPIICTDIYHFGGPQSPNIPNPSSTSQTSYRGCLTGLTEMTRRTGKIPWVMPQAFTEYWGLSWHDAEQNLVLEPGGYWHWRMPTVAEMHWQTWEALRQGCQGVVYFAILLDQADEWTPDKGKMPEKWQKTMADNLAAKRPIVQARTNTKTSSSLLLAGGGATPQSRAMGEDFKTMEQFETKLADRKPAEFPLLFAEPPFAVATFAPRTGPGDYSGIVVNDDLQTKQTAPLYFLPNVSRVTDLITGQPLPLSPATISAHNLQQAVCTLEPGCGVILLLETGGQDAGILLSREDFSLNRVWVELENLDRQPEPRSFGMGWQWTVRRAKQTADKPSTVTISALSPATSQASPLAGSLNLVKTGQAAVYFQAEGWFPKAESLIVAVTDKTGKNTWLQSNSYQLPVLLPADTASLQLQLTADAALTGFRFWRVPLNRE